MEMDKLKPKQSAFITRVGGDGALRHHLLDMGLTPGTEITLQKIAPMKTYTNEKLLPTANRKGINLFRIHE